MIENTEPWIVSDAIRAMFRVIDSAVYRILGYMYQIFFNVTSAEIFTDTTISNVFARVQLIIGVFMIFKLAVSIIKGIVNPDTFTDKNSGMGNIIYRIIVSLVMLSLIVPIRTSGGNEFYQKIGNNGLLFGTLYSLQTRIIENNTLGRLILGTTDNATTNQNNKKDKLKETSDVFVSTIVKGFVRVNVKDESVSENNRGNWVCGHDSKMTEYMTEYNKLDADPLKVIQLTDLKCDKSGMEENGFWDAFSGDNTDRYAFAYIPFFSAAVGIVFVIVLLSFTIDITVRAVKLGILRLVAPIPIISYIDPNSGKGGMFASWSKTVTSTYIDLFVRLATIYFVMFIIQDIIVNGIIVDQNGGSVGILTKIFIFVGLFIFAKKAPKFIKQVFGLKDDGGNIFGGLGEVLGLGDTAAGLGASVIGGIGAGIAAGHASANADRVNEKSTTGFYGGLNKAKNVVAGIAGGVTGFGAGTKAALTSKDHHAKAAFDAIQKKNAINLSRGSSGSTLFGRIGSKNERMFYGRDTYDRLNDELSAAKEREGAAKDLFGYLEGKGKSDYAGYTVQTKFDFPDGSSTQIRGSYNELARKRAAAEAGLQNGGKGTFDFGGRTWNVNDADVSKLSDQIAAEAGREWALAKGDKDQGYIQKRDDYAHVAEYDSSTGTDRRFNVNEQDAVNKLKKTSKISGGKATHIERDSRFKKAKADHGASGGK